MENGSEELDSLFEQIAEYEARHPELWEEPEDSWED